MERSQHGTKLALEWNIEEKIARFEQLFAEENTISTRLPMLSARRSFSNIDTHTETPFPDPLFFKNTFPKKAKEDALGTIFLPNPRPTPRDFRFPRTGPFQPACRRTRQRIKQVVVFSPKSSFLSPTLDHCWPFPGEVPGASAIWIRKLYVTSRPSSFACVVGKLDASLEIFFFLVAVWENCVCLLLTGVYTSPPPHAILRTDPIAAVVTMAFFFSTRKLYVVSYLIFTV